MWLGEHFASNGASVDLGGLGAINISLLAELRLIYFGQGSINISLYGAKPEARNEMSILTPMPPQEPSGESDGSLCQIGICPSCHPDEIQRLLFAEEKLVGPIKDRGRLIDYEYSDVLSLFRCQG